jgi:hypothetical protein
VGNNRARPPIEPALGTSHKGLWSREPLRRPAKSKRAKSDQAESKTGDLTGSSKHRISTHLEYDLSQAERDALIGLPFS